jgi:hypothetical protein
MGPLARNNLHLWRGQEVDARLMTWPSSDLIKLAFIVGLLGLTFGHTFGLGDRESRRKEPRRATR